MQILMRSAEQAGPDFYPPSWLVIIAALVVLFLIGSSSTSTAGGAVLGGIFGLGTFLLFVFRLAIALANNIDPTAQGLELLTQLSIVLSVWIGIFALVGLIARE